MMRLEDAAEPAAVAAAWRGGQAEQDRVRIGVDDLADRSRRAVMRLIDHQQIGRRQLHGLGADGAPMQRLNRGDLHMLQRPRRGAGHDDAVRDRDVAQLLAGLRDDLAPMREHQHDFRDRHRTRLDDGAGDDGLARSGRRHQHDAPVARGDAAIKLGDDVVLIGPQFGCAHGAPDRQRGCCDSGTAAAGDGALDAGRPIVRIGHQPVGERRFDQPVDNFGLSRVRRRQRAGTARTLRD